MNDGAGGCNQKPLIGARASALPKNLCGRVSSYRPHLSDSTRLSVDSDFAKCIMFFFNGH